MADVLKKWPVTEAEYWGSIEEIGGMIWQINHDIGRGEYKRTPEIEAALEDYQNTIEKLASELPSKFGVILPVDCPKTAAGMTAPPAPEGKTYYWDWYNRMKTESQRSYLDGLICSACPYCEGAESMNSSRIPCSLFSGIMYHLVFPFYCGMISNDGMEESEFAAKLLREHGSEALDKFNKKKAELTAAAQAQNYQ